MLHNFNLDAHERSRCGMRTEEVEQLQPLERYADCTECSNTDVGRARPELAKTSTRANKKRVFIVFVIY